MLEGKLQNPRASIMLKLLKTMDYQIPTDQISARDEGVSRENVSPGTEKARVKV